MKFLYFLQEIRTPFLDAIISAVTHLGEETLFMIFALLFFWCFDKKRGYYLLFTGFAGIVSIQFLKMIFRIPRPWVLDPEFPIVESARAEATGYSFPSGHTQCATALYGGVARSSKTRWVQLGGIGVVLAVAFSRMYLGVHTPKDVLVSLAVGAAWVLIVYPILYHFFEKPRAMYCVIGSVLLLSLANLLFVFLYQFPSDVDAVNLADAEKTACQLFAIVLAMCILYPVDHYLLKFQTDAVWWAQILKLVGGVAIVLAVRLLLKSPLNALFGVNIGCGVRYFLMVIAAGILWPMTFGWFARLGRKKEEI